MLRVLGRVAEQVRRARRRPCSPSAARPADPGRRPRSGPRAGSPRALRCASRRPPGAALAQAGERLQATSKSPASIRSCCDTRGRARPSHRSSRGSRCARSCGKRTRTPARRTSRRSRRRGQPCRSPSALITAARSSAAGVEVNRSEACTQLPSAILPAVVERFRAVRRRLLEGFAAGRAGEVLQRRAAQRRRFAGAAIVDREHVRVLEQRPVHRAVARGRAARVVGRPIRSTGSPARPRPAPRCPPPGRCAGADAGYKR